MSEARADSTYHRFTLGNWNTRASVRSSRHNYLLPVDLAQQLETRHWFPPALVPYLSHPAIAQAGRSTIHRLTANHLVYFLDYTTLLEHRIVNRSVETIIHGELGVRIPQPMKTAALQLYTDEGFHALFSDGLAARISRFYSIVPRPVMPRRITRLNALLTNVPKRHKPLAWFLTGFVSETIIARELLEVCRDALVSCVEEMLRDHLIDEARHSRYFCEVFEFLWLTLDGGQRTFAARLLLDILLIFFDADEQWLMSSLHSAGLGEQAVCDILCDISGTQAVIRRARSGADATLQALKKAGFFDLPSNQQLFTQAGLVDG
ncbi:diiron oxygenase [Pseudomonas sp. N3-W]|uniref:Diiron oxygenase n=1 Tax=Pseudomonas fungipugnans TaxID=3024217 RepID=A0ABT6QP09_9PSED|nr:MULTISPECIES: diiron oxygenase [unclassified Pseudomonas]MDI2592558.1 diiron oxygenase [Pseudomonas sp. 681]UWF49039.1 diiron oxygenase [Pseudomonas sp. N3-W]